MANRTAVTTPLWLILGMAAIVATLLTFVAASITWGGMPPAAGKQIAIGALLVFPLVIAAKCEWTSAVSIVFAFLAYFVLSIALMLVFMREKVQDDVQLLHPLCAMSHMGCEFNRSMQHIR